MAKKNYLMEMLGEQEQPEKTAPINRSIDNQYDAWNQALEEQPSTFTSNNPTNKIDVWNPTEEQPKGKEKKSFFGINIPDGSENVWDYDATNNIINTSASNSKEEKTDGKKNNLLDMISSPKGMKHEEFQDKQSKANKVGTLIGGTLEQGSGVAVQGATSLMDNLFGGFTQELHTLANLTLDGFGIGKSGAPLGEKNIISSVADWVRDTNKKEAEYYGKNAEELGDIGKAVNKYGTMVVAAAPAAILAMATSGASAPSTAGLQAISAAETAGTQFGYYTQMCNNAIRQMASSPNFQASFIQEAGHAYDEALSDGATEEEAAIYSLLYATWASTVEVGGSDENLGGLQKLPDKLKKALAAGDKSTVLKIAKSAAGEIGEENLQGILGAGFKSMYQPTPIWGGDNAIIDPKRMAEEAKGAGIVATLLGGGQAVGTAIDANANVNSPSNPLIREETSPIASTDEVIDTSTASKTVPTDESIETAPVTEEIGKAEPIVEEAPPVSDETPLAEESAETAEAPPMSETERNEVFTGDQVPTQSNIHDQYTEEEAARPELNPENDTHVQHHDTEVDEFANRRIESGAENARSDLLSRDPASWDDVDVRTAQKLIEQELSTARSLEGVDQDAAYARIAELRDAYNAQGTASGQALRQRQSFSGTPDEITSEAASVLFGEESKGKLRNMSPEQKSAVMKSVEDYSDRLNNVSNDDPASMIKLIKDIADTRKTKPILDIKGIKLDKVLEKVSKMDGGMEFLRNLATTQTRSIAYDYINPGIINKLKAVKYLNMLGNPATSSRNVGANTVFGTFIDAVSSDMATPIDSLMSLATNKRSTTVDRMISPESFRGSIDAGLKSWLEVTLDAEADQASYAYNEIKGRTFKANANNFIERFLSSLERNQGYQLKTTDQLSKGGVEAETAAGLNRIGVNQKEALDIAKEEAKYRTLQSDSEISGIAKDARRLLNKVSDTARITLKDKQGGSYGLGDDVLPFAQVPANVVKTELDMNPLSIFPAAKKVFSVMAKGESATVQEQRSAAKAAGRALNGLSMVALSTFLSSQGIVRYTDDDDANLKQLHKAQGKNGLQINASAALRFMSGQGSEQKAGDKWISLGWLPQVNSLFIIGNLIYDDYKDMPEEKSFYDYANLVKKGAFDSVEGMYRSLLEFPAVSTITSMINAGKYAEVDKESDTPEFLQRAEAVALDKAANTATGFLVPNALRAVAAGIDDTERDLYTQTGELGQAIDYVKAGIPGLRETLPAQVDNYGNPIKNEGGLQQFLNKTVLPGPITEDKENPFYDEIEDLAEATGNTKVIPSKSFPKSFSVNGINFVPNYQERLQNQVVAGHIAESLARDFMASPEYDEFTEDQKASIIANLNSVATKAAKSEYDKSQGGSGLNINLETAVDDAIASYKKTEAKQFVDTAREADDVNLLLQAVDSYSENGGSAKTYLKYEAKEKGFIKDGVSNDEGIVNYLLSSSASDEQIDKAVSDYGTKGYKANYNAAREAGASPKEASEIISSVDGYGEKGKDNGSLTQAELKAYASDNPEQEAFIRAIWDAQGWSKDFDGNKYAG